MPGLLAGCPQYLKSKPCPITARKSSRSMKAAGMDREIVAYCDQLASTYDADRFANSYGQFIDRRERQILKANRILDIGCCTGRLTNCATHGCEPAGKAWVWPLTDIPRRHSRRRTLPAADPLIRTHGRDY